MDLKTLSLSVNLQCQDKDANYPAEFIVAIFPFYWNLRACWEVGVKGLDVGPFSLIYKNPDRLIESEARRED